MSTRCGCARPAAVIVRLPSRRTPDQRRSRSSRSWWLVAEAEMPSRPARSDTHSSSTDSACRMRVRVGSPRSEKVSARAARRQADQGPADPPQRRSANGTATRRGRLTYARVSDVGMLTSTGRPRQGGDGRTGAASSSSAASSCRRISEVGLRLRPDAGPGHGRWDERQERRDPKALYADVASRRTLGGNRARYASAVRAGFEAQGARVLQQEPAQVDGRGQAGRSGPPRCTRR